MAQDPRGEYEDSLTVNAEVGPVFDFVADVRNLPKYLPTTKSAQKQGADRVRVQGAAEGHSYDSDGYLRPDQVRHRLEWGADEGYYSGWMQLEDRSGRTEVTVHISLRGRPPGADERGGDAPSPDQVKEGIRKGLDSIRNHVEGRGGKEEPSVAD
jgi:uncharacterized membrane protein